LSNNFDEADVLEALKTERIAAASEDVFEEQPTSARNPPFTLDNFVGTPRMAAHSNEGMMRMSMVAQDGLAVLEGRSPESPVPGSC
jgi:D-3-phosphoglycerate dehydrogenase